MRRTLAAIGLTALVLLSAPARADVDARLIASAGASRAFQAADGRIPVLVELAGDPHQTFGASLAAPGFGALRLTPAELQGFVAAHPGARLWWAPPRRPLLDNVGNWTRAGVFRNLTGLTGKGVVVGIVDTGFDPAHPDLRDEAGKSRAIWVIDFSKAPRGLHPELEEEYGCTAEGAQCAVLSGQDVDQMVMAGSPLAPRDPYGHGTHVTSLAAGDGSGADPATYVAPAPEASLIVARVTRSDGGEIYDADILTATRFVFEQAEALGMPVVANLSLGSDFGAHDGSSALERGLAQFVGPERPGRALVVAAGNSGGLYTELAAGYPGPFGIHTEVHVPRSSSVRVPVLSPPTASSVTRGKIYVWISTRPGDQLAVGLDDAEGEWIEPLTPGTGASYEKGGLEATIVNNDRYDNSPIPEGAHGAVVVLEGSWRSGSTFALRFEGHGTARIWIQSEGDLASTIGAVVPRATKQGTIGIPASSPALISVGATINRLAWNDREGHVIRVGSFGALEDPPLDSSAYFSGAGPTSDARMKPDIVAPGVFVIGAMSALADPKVAGNDGIFGGSSICADQPGCLVVDDLHAVSSGTSMAAPIVSGAIALLFERDPTLSQEEVRTLLQAGARRPEGTVTVEQQVGPGSLDLVGSLQVLEAMADPIATEPATAQSWIALASSYAHPDPEWPLAGVLQLRSAAEEIADVDPSRLRLEASPAVVTMPLTRSAPGMWQFAVAAPAGTGLGELQLRILLDDEVLLERRIPIATDPWVAEHGVEARGGCAVGAKHGSELLAPFVVGALALLLRRRSRSP